LPLNDGESILAHHISQDVFEAAECFTFNGQPQRQVCAVCSKALADLRELDVFGADDLDPSTDVMPSTGIP